MRLGALLAAGALAVAVALALVLADSEPRSAGSNYVPENEAIAELRGEGEQCIPSVVPKDAAGLRLLVGTYGRPTPALAVEVSPAGGPSSSGRLAAGQPEGRLVIPMDPIRETAAATVCVRVVDAPASARTVLYGAADQLRLEWVREGSESWYDLLPTVAHRFGLGKANPFGSWLLAIAALMALAAWIAAGRLVLRELRG